MWDAREREKENDGPQVCPDQLEGKYCHQLGLEKAMGRAGLDMESIRSIVWVTLSLKCVSAIQVEM